MYAKQVRTCIAKSGQVRLGQQPYLLGHLIVEHAVWWVVMTHALLVRLVFQVILTCTPTSKMALVGGNITYI